MGHDTSYELGKTVEMVRFYTMADLETGWSFRQPESQRPGRQVSSQPRMYISKLPVLAAAGIRMVRVPLSSGVEISRR